MQVGIRELKNNLSRYLTLVGEGTEIVVTDRGRAVVQITPIGTARTLDRLVAEGIITPATQNKRPAPTTRIHAKRPVSPLVSEQRR